MYVRLRYTSVDGRCNSRGSQGTVQPFYSAGLSDTLCGSAKAADIRITLQPVKCFVGELVQEVSG